MKPCGAVHTTGRTDWYECCLPCQRSRAEEAEGQVEYLTKERDLHVRVFADVQAGRDDAHALLRRAQDFLHKVSDNTSLQDAETELSAAIDDELGPVPGGG